MPDVRLAFGHALLHRIQRAGEPAEFLAAFDIDGLVILPALDAPGRRHQLADRPCCAAPEQHRDDHGEQQRRTADEVHRIPDRMERRQHLACRLQEHEVHGVVAGFDADGVGEKFLVAHLQHARVRIVGAALATQVIQRDRDHMIKRRGDGTRPGRHPPR